MKKIDPTKKVTPSTTPPTASVYAGTDPSTKQAEPTMNRLAIAEFRRTGRTLIPFLRSARRLSLAHGSARRLTPPG
ncbi:hypothetical protein [Virgisporangium aurantiacum]|uniref:hypothetical protein n=1 Tax=Virgisporangium aurantiacum TaxID=175570 RepID=UPI001EF300AD|nr:hypothetical protein [Virgisporangium aurantiacum]